MNNIDYTNIYGTSEYNDYLEKYFLNIEKEEFLDDEERIVISDELVLVHREYVEQKGNRCISMSRNILHKNGKIIHNYITADGHHKPYTKIINHSNGHRYYPFNVDLYGISYIDIDTLEMYNYIPRGICADSSVLCGESFIVTNLFYDISTDLIAYEGCYWAATSDVMAGDFSDPLNFNPHLISIHKLLDSEYEEFDDVDFEKWGEDSLFVRVDDTVREVPLSGITEKIRAIN